MNIKKFFKVRIQTKATISKYYQEKIISKNKLIQEQAESMDFLVGELANSKAKAVDLAREIKELKAKNKFLMARDNKLQELETIVANEKPTLAQLKKLINKKD